MNNHNKELMPCTPIELDPTDERGRLVCHRGFYKHEVVPNDPAKYEKPEDLKFCLDPVKDGKPNSWEALQDLTGAIVEIDVHMLEVGPEDGPKQNLLVVAHNKDYDIGRSEFEELSLDQITKIRQERDIHGRFDENDMRVTTLYEYLLGMGKFDVEGFIELKISTPDKAKAMAEAYVDMVKTARQEVRHMYGEDLKVTAHSFTPEVLKEIRKLDPTMDTSLLWTSSRDRAFDLQEPISDDQLKDRHGISITRGDEAEAEKPKTAEKVEKDETAWLFAGCEMAKSIGCKFFAPHVSRLTEKTRDGKWQISERGYRVLDWSSRTGIKILTWMVNDPDLKELLISHGVSVGTETSTPSELRNHSA